MVEGKFRYWQQYSTIQYNTIQYNTIQYNTIQYVTIQYNKIQVQVLPAGLFNNLLTTNALIQWLRVLARPLSAVHNFLCETLSYALR